MGKTKKPKVFKTMPPYDGSHSRKFCLILDVPEGKDFWDITDDLTKWAIKHPEYNLMLTEALKVEVSEDRKKRIF